MGTTPNNPLADKPRQFNIGDATATPEPQNTVVAASKVDKPDTQADEDDKILKLAHRRFQRVCDFEKKWRNNANKELNFLAGDHWSTDDKDNRKGLPCLTFDKISPAIRQVENSNRQSPPEPRVSPVGDGADVDTAKILQGLIRNIEVDSSADIAHETAFGHATKIGRGWFRVNFEYENEHDFQQKLQVKRVTNPFSVYPDPAADEFDYSDMRYCFVTEDMDADSFDEEYPDAQAENSLDFEGVEDKLKSDWYPNGAIRVAEYWWVEKHISSICQLTNGSIVPWADQRTADPRNVVNTRKVEKRSVHMVKITGSQILERINDYPGKWIPLVAVIGDEIIQDGKRQFRGMIRPAMDANMSYDYMRSKEAQAIGLAPISIFLVPEGGIDGYENEYADANRKPLNVLKYKVRTEDGSELPPPQRINQDVAISAITQAVAHADNDVKSMTQEFDASLGERGPDESGRAIIARQRQGDNAHFNYIDNLGRSMRQEGRILLNLIPHTYSEERVITIYDPDGKSRQVKINGNPAAAQQEAANDAKLKAGADKIYNLKESVDRYDIVIGSGPAFSTRMEQAAAVLPQIIQVAPIIMQAAPDLVLKILNLPYGEELVERVQAFTMGVNDPNMPPAAQAAIKQATQAVQILQAQVKELGDKNRMELIKLASQERQTLVKVLGSIAAVEQKGIHDEFLDLFKAHSEARMQELERNYGTEIAEPPAPGQPGQPGAPPNSGPAPAGPPQPQAPPQPAGPTNGLA